MANVSEDPRDFQIGKFNDNELISAKNELFEAGYQNNGAIAVNVFREFAKSKKLSRFQSVQLASITIFGSSYSSNAFPFIEKVFGIKDILENIQEYYPFNMEDRMNVVGLLATEMNLGLPNYTLINKLREIQKKQS